MSFYTGWIADRIADDMAANGGLITRADLAAYKAVERAPVTGTFLGYDIISMAPPSSGGTAIIEMLNMLEGAEYPEDDAGFGRGAASGDRGHAPRLSRSRALSRAIRTSSRCRSRA